MQNKLPKIIVIVGPTASGKTDLGLVLAKKYNGEIVSADSRLVYSGMDIGTAKPGGQWSSTVILGESSKAARDLSDNGQRFFLRRRNDRLTYVVDGIPHHLIDIVNPDQEFSLADYKKMAVDAIDDILQRGKLPIVVGGTGLYVWALVDNLDIPKVAPDNALRKELESKSLPEIVQMLQEKDPESAARIDLKNPRRVMRALEVVMASGQSFARQQTKSEPLFNALQIGLEVPKEELYKRIEARVDAQIEAGLVEEVKSLVDAEYSWELPSMSGIGYRQIGMCLRGELSLSEAVELLKRDTRQYAKRQLTWFKRDKRIQWVRELDETERLVDGFLSQD